MVLRNGGNDAMQTSQRKVNVDAVQLWKKQW